MIFELAQDFHSAVAVLPREHPKHHMLELLEEAIRRDIHFIARHPTTLFQCMWNTCWWYDCPEAAKHYEEPEGGWKEPPPRESAGPNLSSLLEAWRERRESCCPDNPWLRSCRPPKTRLGERLQAQLQGHNGAVTAVAYAPFGQFLVSASEDATVRVWDTSTGQELRCMQHNSGVTCIALSEANRFAASGDKGGVVRVWDLLTGDILLRLSHGLRICGIAVSPDGRFLATSTHDAFHVFNVQSGKGLSLGRMLLDANCVRFSPDGTMIAVGANGGIILYDLATEKEASRLPCERQVVSVLAFSPDGRLVAGGLGDKSIRIWNVGSGREILRIIDHDADVNSIAFAPDGLFLASSAGNWLHDSVNRFSVWDVRDGHEVRRFGGHEGYVAGVAFSPDGECVAAGSTDCVIRVWRILGEDPSLVLSDHKALVTAVAHSPDGEQIASRSEDCSIRLWSARTGQLRRVIQGHTSTIRSITFSRDGRRVLSGSGDGSARIWEADGGHQCVSTNPFLNGGVNEAVFSPDNQHVLTATKKGDVVVCSAQTGQEERLLHSGDWKKIAWSIACSPCGQFAVCGFRDGTISVWDWRTAEEQWSRAGHRDSVWGVSFSADGRVIASRSHSCLRLWDGSTGECLTSTEKEYFDLAAFASGPAAFPFLVTLAAPDAVLELAQKGTPLAWFPLLLAPNTTNRANRLWAGGSGRYTAIVSLEGGCRPIHYSRVRVAPMS